MQDATPLFSASQTNKTRRAKAWLDAQFDRMRKEGEFCVLSHMVTPELAEALLEINEGNRPKRTSHISRLARAISEGRWINTGAPISVSHDKRLRDGQHRLSALVESGRSVVMDIRFGIDPAAFKVMDTGAIRGGGDVLAIFGYVNTAALAGAARMIERAEKGFASKVGNAQAMDNDELLAFIPLHPGIEDAVRIGHATAQRMKCGPSPLGCAAYLISAKYGPEKAEAFFGALRDGIGFRSTREPLARLRDIILTNEYDGRFALAALTVKAWNKHRNGRLVGALRWSPGEPFPGVE